MNIRWTVYSLPLLLFISISLTTADPEESENQTKNDVSSSDTTEKMFRFVAAGNELEKQYPYISLKLFELAYNGVSAFDILSLIPHLLLAKEQVKTDPRALEEFDNAFADLRIQDINLAKLIRDPELIKKAFSDAKCSKLLDEAMQVIAGPEANNIFDLLMNEIFEHLDKSPNGITGINADELTQLAIKSPHFKQLFPDEKAKKGLDIINIYMNMIVSPKLKEMKREIFIEVSERKSAQKNDGQNSENKKDFLHYKVKTSLANATMAYYTVAKYKIQEKIKEHNENAKNIVDKWKVDAEDNISYVDPSLWNFVKSVKSEILIFAPTAFLYPFAMAKSIVSDNESVVSRIAPYFLPVGSAFIAFKFICLLTYVTLVAQKEDIEIPHLSDKMKAIIEVPGFKTDIIINLLNNKKLMNKIFPDDSSKSLKILKFIGGADVRLVDAIVRQLRIYTADKKIGEVDVMTILNNRELVLKLVRMDEFNDVKLQTYFNVDTREEADQIVKEIQQLKQGQLKGVLKNWTDMGKIRERTSKSFNEMVFEKYAEITKRANEATIKMKETNDGYVSYVISRLPDSWLQKYNFVNIVLTEDLNKDTLPAKKKNN